MKQYLELVKAVVEKGTIKPAARENMPGTTSLFGYQFRHDLSEGFPLLTTKKINFKHIVVELLWFLNKDDNIKFMVDNDCNIWNEDAYNFYVKILENAGLYPITFKDFINAIKTNKTLEDLKSVHGGIIPNYKLGNTGEQYPKLWREWQNLRIDEYDEGSYLGSKIEYRDQIKDLLDGLKSNPQSRRHIITAWNPSTLDKMALNACHCLVQFNCRPLTSYQREDYYAKINNFLEEDRCEMNPNCTDDYVHELMDKEKIPRYYLDCQMYQRSADAFLGVPFNIASYALLTEILSKLCNMVAGEFIHTFGDVHIYDNHQDQINEQLEREPSALPKLKIKDEGNDWAYIRNTYDFSMLDTSDFSLANYNPQARIKGKLSTGLK